MESGTNGSTDMESGIQDSYTGQIYAKFQSFLAKIVA